MKEKLFTTEEQKRLDEHATRPVPIAVWGPYLSERQWGTVREDYSANGDAWNYFSHDQSRSRAYRWGEDGIAGISDYNQHLCFAIALWNHKDPILKERLFGLTNNEGNHGEDCKELYYYLDNTPTHSYMRMLYKYPQAEFPYTKLVQENARKSKFDPEYELLDTGVMNDGNYFDVFTEYSKNTDTDIFIKITIINRSNNPSPITVLPTLWFRNNWSFNPNAQKPSIQKKEDGVNKLYVEAQHATLGNYYLYFSTPSELLFTENDTNKPKLFNTDSGHQLFKDAFHEYIVNQASIPVAEQTSGTKCSPVYRLELQAKQKTDIYLRLCNTKVEEEALQPADKVSNQRYKEAIAFLSCLAPDAEDQDLRKIMHQALSSLLWSKQFYYYDVDLWVRGDPHGIPPPMERMHGRNHNWLFLNNRDILLMPDKWEYPWYAAWDLAFHCIPMAFADPGFAKNQMTLLLREWYMNPEGQLPAYEWNFSDVNPPVHAWACLNIYRIEKTVHGRADVAFLKRVFQKLLINFTWWVNRKDNNGNNIFEGGFLGLDNIAIVNRSALPPGYTMDQVDGTSWMAMYALNMMDIALEIAVHDETFEDVATKFYEHFVLIASSLNEAHLWDQEDDFFYDVINAPDGSWTRVKVRSVVGLSVLYAVSVIKSSTLEKLNDFKKRTNWFKNYRQERSRYLPNEEKKENNDILLSLISKDKLVHILQRMLDEQEFLAPGGIRSLSKFHEKNPLHFNLDHQGLYIQYDPAESTSGMFGGNSNWRGPVWAPVNYLIIKALKKYHQFYGDDVQLEYPTGSGNKMNLGQISGELAKRFISIFREDENGNRPVHRDHAAFYQQVENKDLLLFYEYFHGDTSRGIGATHQTGWTAIVAELINDDAWEWE